MMTSTKEVSTEVSAVVASHDGFSDIWPGFFNLLFRFWPDLPYPLYLISNHLTFQDVRVNRLRVGDDISWSATLARGLARISSRYVLLMLDDFFLTGPVDTEGMARLHSAMVTAGAAYLRLSPNPRPDTVCPNTPHIGAIGKGAPYRTSLQIAFWDRLVLLSLLRQEESAWDFELKGSRRSDRLLQPFLSVCDDISIIPYSHVIQRGKLLPNAVRYFTPLGIQFDLQRRPIECEFYLRWQSSFVRRGLGRAWRFISRRTF